RRVLFRSNAARSNMPKILLNAQKARAQQTTARVRAITEREVEERRARAAAARQRAEVREQPRFDVPSAGLAAGRTVLALEDVSVCFPGAGRPILENVSLRIIGPERVALVGPNGSGKTTLLRVVLGELNPSSGRVRTLPRSEIGFLEQTGAQLDPSLSVLDNFRARHPTMEPTPTRYALARFLFSHEAALQIVGTLSGGERLRASLACVLAGPVPPSLVVLDEPTNHLGFDALHSLESALRGYDGALLVVSHDRDFLDAIGIDRWIRLPCFPETSGYRRATRCRRAVRRRIGTPHVPSGQLPQQARVAVLDHRATLADRACRTQSPEPACDTLAGRAQLGGELLLRARHAVAATRAQRPARLCLSEHRGRHTCRHVLQSQAVDECRKRAQPRGELAHHCLGHLRMRAIQCLDLGHRQEQHTSVLCDTGGRQVRAFVEHGYAAERFARTEHSEDLLLALAIRPVGADCAVDHEVQPAARRALAEQHLATANTAAHRPLYERLALVGSQ